MSVYKRNILIAVLMVAVAVCASVVAIRNQSIRERKAEDQLNELMVQYNELQEQHDVAEVAFVDKRDEAMKNVLKIDANILTQDMESIRKVLTPAYSWTSNQEYDAARNTLSKTLPEDSGYLQYILVDRSTYNRDGTVLNLDKDGLKCSCEKLDIYPFRTDSKTREYNVLVDYISYKNNDIEKHDHLTVDRQILVVTVNDKHEITNIDLEQCDSIVNYRTVR